MIPRIRLASLILSILLILCLQLHISQGLLSPLSSKVEAFSVAPMMGHTNRHYRYLFRQLSEHAHLYTEMIPASQIVQVYEMASRNLLGATTRTKNTYDNPDDLLETVHAIRQQLQLAHQNPSLDIKFFNLLHELLDNNHKDPQVALQLGGRDPDTLAKATAIATAFGYRQINLNCGCPSSTVASGKHSGAALMREPELVARCLDAMSESMPYDTILSVKHRLGVANADTYNASWDHAQNDQAAYESCREFCRFVTMTGKASKIHIHARLALLGLGTAPSGDNDDGTDTDDDAKSRTLWTPGRDNDSVNDTTTEMMTSVTATKINHKRVQYLAKRQARQATIQNRSVPPLRPKVVERIAEEFGHLEVVSNGGIQSMTHIKDRLADNQVAGVMVGRSAINHPCSFAQVDSILWNAQTNKPSRQQVLQTYIEYCEEQETQMRAAFPGRSNGEVQDFRRKLIAVPFHLFMGEDGNNAYQRRLRKLSSRGHRHSAASMLVAAMRELPTETLEKSVEEYTPWDDIEKFDFTKRAGAMQRTIY
jgi:tRNA-dihydrouridine synthase